MEIKGPWVEKYRPTKIDDCILPEKTKKAAKQIIKNSSEMPNLLFSGSSGTGKTTLAKAIFEELGCDYMVINASKDGNIDTLRTKILDYASKSSFEGGRKFILLDEGDYLNPNSTQPALRNFTEEYAANCGFIITCNYPNKIIAPLKSRFSHIDFKISKEDKKMMIREIFERYSQILTAEKVTFNKEVLLQHIMNFYPDIRKALNELQFYAQISGTIDSGILFAKNGKEIEELVDVLIGKDFSKMRKWVAENESLQMEQIIEPLYNSLSSKIQQTYLPQIILHLANYDYRNSFVSNKSINITALLTEIMRDI